MIKSIAIAMLFLGKASFCFSQEVPRNIDVFGMTVSPSLIYTACGNGHLLVRDFELALEDFYKASACLEQFEGRSPLVELFILFGESVAYDNLDLRDRCEQSLTSLILTLNTLQNIERQDEAKEDSKEDDESTFFEDLKTIARLCPSDDVKDILLSIV